MTFEYATYDYEASKDLARAARDIKASDYSRAGVYMQQAIEKK